MLLKPSAKIRGTARVDPPSVVHEEVNPRHQRLVSPLKGTFSQNQPMDARAELTEMPLKLVISIAIAMFCLTVLMQFVRTSERAMLKDLDVQFQISSSRLTVKVFDAQTGKPVGGTTITVSYPGGMKAHTLGTNSNSYTFTIPSGILLVNVRVTKSGYLPWEGEVALG